MSPSFGAYTDPFQSLRIKSMETTDVATVEEMEPSEPSCNVFEHSPRINASHAGWWRSP